MHVIEFEITQNDTVKTLTERLEKFALQVFLNLPSGKWELVIRKPQRTSKQNRAIHALFTDAATELNGIGVEVAFGNFRASWTPDLVKEFFVLCYLGGTRTSKTDTKQLANAVDKFMHDVNAKGGSLSINDPWLDDLLLNN